MAIYLTKKNDETGKVEKVKVSGNNLYDSDFVTTKTEQTIGGKKTFTETGVFSAGVDVGTKPALIVGTETGSHLAFDNNEIQAFGSNGTSPNWLGLNKSGGNIGFASNANGMSLTPNSNLSPIVNNNLDLGTTKSQWKNLYLAGNLSDGTLSKSISEIISGITQELQSPVRIWDLADGIYKLPASCVVYYQGATSENSYTFYSTSYLIVTSLSTTHKQFIVFGGAQSDGTATYFSSGYVTETTGTLVHNRMNAVLVNAVANYTISGSSTYTGNNKIKATYIDITTPSTTQYKFLDFVDKNNSRIGLVGAVQQSGGNYGMYMQAGNFGSIGIIGTSTSDVRAFAPTPSADSNTDTIATTGWVNQFVKTRNMVPQGKLAQFSISDGIKTTGIVLYTATQNCFAFVRIKCGNNAGYINLSLRTSSGIEIGNWMQNMSSSGEGHSGVFPMKTGMNIAVENSSLTTIDWADMTVCSVGE